MTPMKVRYRKVTEYGVTHYTFPVKKRGRKLYKPICIPNGTLYANLLDADGAVTCKKCWETIRRPS
jgi:hypothetical protein